MAGRAPRRGVEATIPSSVGGCSIRLVGRLTTGASLRIPQRIGAAQVVHPPTGALIAFPSAILASEGRRRTPRSTASRHERPRSRASSNASSISSGRSSASTRMSDVPADLADERRLDRGAAHSFFIRAGSFFMMTWLTTSTTSGTSRASAITWSSSFWFCAMPMR